MSLNWIPNMFNMPYYAPEFNLAYNNPYFFGGFNNYCNIPRYTPLFERSNNYANTKIAPGGRYSSIFNNSRSYNNNLYSIPSTGTSISPASTNSSPPSPLGRPSSVSSVGGIPTAAETKANIEARTKSSTVSTPSSSSSNSRRSSSSSSSRSTALSTNGQGCGISTSSMNLKRIVEDGIKHRIPLAAEKGSNANFSQIKASTKIATNSSIDHLGYNAEKGRRLAEIALRDSVGWAGWCSEAVSDAIINARIDKHIGRADACDMIPVLQRSKKFKQISPVGIDVNTLPAGCILQFNAWSSGYKEFGHIEITTGTGRAVSDGITQNLQQPTAIFIPV